MELQLPPQAKAFGSARNWLAETVPAQRTPVTIVASSVDLIIFLRMIAPFLLEGRLTVFGTCTGLAIGEVLFQFGQRRVI